MSCVSAPSVERGCFERSVLGFIGGAHLSFLALLLDVNHASAYYLQAGCLLLKHPAIHAWAVRP